MKVNAELRASTTDLVWLQTGFIGDIVLTTAAMRLARKYWPERPQHLITTKVGAQILADAPELDSCHVFDKSGSGMSAATRDVKASLRATMGKRSAILLRPHRSTRSMLLARTLKLPEITYDEASWSILAWRRVPRVAVLHEAQRIALLLEPLGVSRSDICTALPHLVALDPDPSVEWQQQILAHRGQVIAVAPGSVWGTKRWLPAHFAQLIKALTALKTTLVVMIGSPDEVPIAQQVTSMIGPNPSVLNIVGKTSLADMRRILPRCQLLVANDSSPIHYASAIRVPTVAIFGATIPSMGFGPLAPGSVSVGVDLGCRPCSDHGPQVCPLDHFRCMSTLSVNLVLEACERVLSSRSGKGS